MGKGNRLILGKNTTVALRHIVLYGHLMVRYRPVKAKNASSSLARTVSDTIFLYNTF